MMSIARKAALAAVAAGALVAAAPAQADFHSLCMAPAGATPALSVEGSDFRFSGTVNCGGATKLVISSLTLSPPSPLPGSSGVGPNADCDDCSTLTTAGTAPAAPGVYTVVFAFGVATPLGSTSPQHVRQSIWIWPGVGQPIKLCGRDAEPIAAPFALHC